MNRHFSISINGTVRIREIVSLLSLLLDGIELYLRDYVPLYSTRDYYNIGIVDINFSFDCKIFTLF